VPIHFSVPVSWSCCKQLEVVVARNAEEVPDARLLETAKQKEALDCDSRWA
jgi:hypothetical protein